MPGNKETCAGTGRSCIGGGNSREGGRRPQGAGAGVLSEAREPGQGVGVGENQPGTRVCSLGGLVWEGGAAAQQEKRKTSEELSLGGSPATWLLRHSREESASRAAL